jgi:UDP-3-O-[3-hydroxymyristoyl] N-acetylglucosamine deacetylase
MSVRTFGFMKDVEALRARGLALGGSLENAVVLDDERILNPEGLRYKNEFVRHKILDAIGDMMTLGHPLLGHLVLYKSGHDLMNQLMKAILADKSSYSICQLTENDFKSDFKAV